MNKNANNITSQNSVEPLSFFSHILGADPGTGWITFATATNEDDFKPMLCYPTEFADAQEKSNMFTGKNLYYGCALMDGIGIATRNCISAKAVIADVDYGKDGHKQESPFKTESEVLEHLTAMKIRPSMIYNTGHGVVAIYLLKKSICFSDTDEGAQFDDAKKRLYRAVKGDSTTSRQHYFRYPCTVNKKPGCPPVTGYVIQSLDTTIRYSLEDILGALPGVKSKSSRKNKPCAPRKIGSVELPDVSFGDIDSPADLDILPDLHDTLADDHPVGTRSDVFFKVVLELHSLGASLACIRELLTRNPSLSDKYAGRLDTEIARCASKAEECTETQYLRLSPPNTVEYVRVAIEEEA